MYWVAVTVHVVATAAYGALVVRDIVRPWQDPVRAGGADDPSGGVFDGAEDRFVLGADVDVSQAEPSAPQRTS